MSAVFFAQIKDLTARVIALETAVAELKTSSEVPESPEEPAKESPEETPKRRGRPRKAEQ